MGVNRKQFRLKRHSCALCKPNKMGWSPRFKEKEVLLARIHRVEMQENQG